MKTLFSAALIGLMTTMSKTSAKITVLGPENLKNKFDNDKLDTVNANFGHIPYG